VNAILRDATDAVHSLGSRFRAQGAASDAAEPLARGRV
jgi:hypothetical protein